MWYFVVGTWNPILDRYNLIIVKLKFFVLTLKVVRTVKMLFEKKKFPISVQIN